MRRNYSVTKRSEKKFKTKWKISWFDSQREVTYEFFTYQILLSVKGIHGKLVYREYQCVTEYQFLSVIIIYKGPVYLNV